jgi:hypothetical protein
MRFLTQIDLLASEAVAQKILDRENLKSAKLRLQLMVQEGKHMCLAPGCRIPVVGKRIFEHCENHLSEIEKEWWRDDIESPNWKRPLDDPSEHPYVKAAREISEERRLEIAKEIVSRKDKALAEARNLVEEASRLETERSVFLPFRLRQRINTAYAALLGDVGENREEFKT